MKIKGYLFDTEEQCQEAIDLINASIGLPDGKHDSHSHPQINADKWFIVEDNFTIPILGEGIEFEFTPPRIGE